MCDIEPLNKFFSKSILSRSEEYKKDINIQKDSLYYLNVTVCDQDDNNRDSHFNIRGYDPNNKLYSSILTEQFK